MSRFSDRRFGTQLIFCMRSPDQKNFAQNRTKYKVLNGTLSCSKSRWKKKIKKKSGAAMYWNLSSFFWFFLWKKYKKNYFFEPFFFLLFFFQRLLEHESIPLSTMFFVLFWCEFQYKFSKNNFRRHSNILKKCASQPRRILLGKCWTDLPPPTNRIAPRMWLLVDFGAYQPWGVE